MTVNGFWCMYSTNAVYIVRRFCLDSKSDKSGARTRLAETL